MHSFALTLLNVIVVSTPYKGKVVLHPTPSSFRTCPQMFKEYTLYLLRPPLETRGLIILLLNNRLLHRGAKNNLAYWPFYVRALLMKWTILNLLNRHVGNLLNNIVYYATLNQQVRNFRLNQHEILCNYHALNEFPGDIYVVLESKGGGAHMRNKSSSLPRK